MTAALRPAVPLSDANLGRLPTRVSAPAYDRRALQPGVVHMSVGSFHRSHQAVYFDELARTGERGWGIVGVGLRRPRLRAALAPQDGLYTVVSRGAERDEARVVGAMTRFHVVPEDRAAALDALVDERTALVTLTITAAAYDADAAGEGPCALGFLAEALDRRRRLGRAPLTVLSCDNLPGNGSTARRALLASAAARDERLADWIDEHVTFPSSMVDRITPQTTVADREALLRDFGVVDRWPVVTEPYSQWVLEDDFCNRRPPLDRVGVQFVDDVAPYALMKTRLLNASHCAIGFLGSLVGLRRTDEVMRDQVLSAYVERFMDEVSPLLPPVPGVDLHAYKRTLRERLANPRIGDELQRLCRAGSSKVPSHVLPSIAQARARGAEHRLLTTAVAAWLRCLRGTDELGRPIALDDPLAARLALAARRGSDPRPLLAACPGFADLRDDDGFVAELDEALVALDRNGVRLAVAERLEREMLAA